MTPLRQTLALAILALSFPFSSATNANQMPLSNPSIPSMALPCPQIASIKTRLAPLLNLSLPPETPEHVIPRINAAKSLARGYMDMVEALSMDMDGGMGAECMNMMMDMPRVKINRNNTVLRSRIARTMNMNMTRNMTNTNTTTNQTQNNMQHAMQSNSLITRQGGPTLPGLLSDVLSTACDAMQMVAVLIQPLAELSGLIQSVMSIMGCGGAMGEGVEWAEWEM